MVSPVLKPRQTRYGQKFYGQNISEYSLILGLAVITCLVSLNTIGSEVKNFYSNLFTPSLTSNNGTVLPVRATPAGGGQYTKVSPTRRLENLSTSLITHLPFNSATQNLKTLGVKTVEWKSPDGKKHQFKIEDPNRILETTGPNGLTNAYLAQLDAFVDVLQDALPANDPTLIEFEALAQKGHQVASAQRNVKTLFANLDTTQQFLLAQEKAKRETNFTCPHCSSALDNLDLAALETGLSSDSTAPPLAGAANQTNFASGKALLQFMIKATEINQKQLNQPHTADLKKTHELFCGQHLPGRHVN